jgi:hypothetical protein
VRRLDRRGNAHHIALKLGNDLDQNLVLPDVGMALEEEDANHVSTLTRKHNGGAIMTNDSRNPTTTDAGIPVASDEHSLTVGPDGPILLQDHYLIEQMANFNRERTPERQPHARAPEAHVNPYPAAVK